MLWQLNAMVSIAIKAKENVGLCTIRSKGKPVLKMIRSSSVRKYMLIC